MQHIVEHLSKDKKLAQVLKTIPIEPLALQKPIYLHLCRNVMGQQLSTKVAATIYNRFLELFNNKPTIDKIIEIDFEVLKSIGLSNAKTHYIKNICIYFKENKLSDSKLIKLSKNEIIELLLPIKGVGKWTIEMLMMFCLQKEDVFSVDDLGIQQGMCKLYNIKSLSKKDMKNQMNKISNKWHPYQTYACKLIWRWKDNIK